MIDYLLDEPRVTVHVLDHFTMNRQMVSPSYSNWPILTFKQMSD